MQVRDVMSHTSGLTYDFLEDFPVAEQYREKRIGNDPTRTLEQFVDELATIPLAFAPGTQWHYSVGIDVAARLLEVISGQKLGEFLQERLFGPLGMTDTAFGVPESARGRLAAMYGLPDIVSRDMTFSKLAVAFVSGDLGRREVEATYPSDAPDVFQRGGHGLFGTASDYLRFANMLLTGKAEDGTRIVGRKTLELMHTNHLAPALLPWTLAGVPTPGYGFGLGSRVAMDIGQSALAGSPRRVRLVRCGEDLLLGRSGRGGRRRPHDAAHGRLRPARGRLPGDRLLGDRGLTPGPGGAGTPPPPAGGPRPWRHLVTVAGASAGGASRDEPAARRSRRCVGRVSRV